MKFEAVFHPLLQFFKERSVPFVRENGRIIAHFLLTAFFIGIGIWFIKHERAELGEVKNALASANWKWVLSGITLTVVYIFLQGLMYVASFVSIRSKISLGDATILFLKRNFISVFLPAGGVSSLAFFTGVLKKKGLKETQIHFASSVYGFVGILTVVIVAIPSFLFALSEGMIGSGEWYALLSVLILAAALILIYRSIMNNGLMYVWLVKFIPSAEVFMNDLQNNNINKKKFLWTIFYSILIECTGITHLYIAMLALNFSPLFFGAVMAYLVSVIFLIVSPFLRGLGAIEVSMSYVLIRFGFGNVEAIAVTFLYRFFEFWMPLLAGIFTFLLKLNKLLLRIVPALLLFCLGIINIVSVLTPAISERLARIKDFLPVEVIHASNYLVMMAGIFSLLTAAFMLKGLRTAWWFALALSIVSCLGHLTKAIDFEEAAVALIIIVILLATRKEYYIKNNPRLRLIGLQTSLLSVAAVLIYGTVGFYFLDAKHFDMDFSLFQSIRYTLQNYFLIGSNDLVATSPFANHFLISIKISGALTLGFLIYTLVRPFVPENIISLDELNIANELLKQFGNSSLDYFKTYRDKSIFLSSNKKTFISYRISGNFAVALENPVGEDDDELKICISEFDKFCIDSGMKCFFYRVPEDSLRLYTSIGKKYIFIGQEGIVDLDAFSLEGGSKKSLRNSLNKVREKQLKATIHVPPIKDGVLQKLKSVSDEWLIDTGRQEIVFAQGMFVWEELKQQTVITAENAEEKIIAFLNVIPDFAPGEGTYDLIRKTKDAPNGTMDFILIELFNYLKSQNYRSVNLGLVPMGGIDDPHTFPERSMKYAYEKIKSFSHYKGLRDFKEKFSPVWKNAYLIYSHDYDLLQVPSVLAKVFKP